MGERRSVSVPGFFGVSTIELDGDRVVRWSNPSGPTFVQTDPSRRPRYVDGWITSAAEVPRAPTEFDLAREFSGSSGGRRA